MVDGQPRYACPVCGVHCKEKFNMTRHIKAIHSGQQQNCPYCPFSTNWQSNLKRHVLSVHKALPKNQQK